MRYAIFSDVHANRQAWEAARADMERMEVDTLVCLGDVVGYGPMPLEVLTAVREATPNFVLGNHDAAACGRLDDSIFNPRARTVIAWTRERLDEEAVRFLQGVPLQMDGTDIQFVHAEMMEPGEFGYVDGVGPAKLNLQAMTRPLGFIGHTHLPLAFTMPKKGGPVRQLPPIDFEIERGQRYLVNVGSVGEPRTTDVRASYVVYDDAERRIYFRRVVFDVEAYKADLEATGLDICPYFVQVVDAGKVAGEPVPAAAPQLALSQLPRVAEVVAGHHGRLQVGQIGGGWGAQGTAAPVAPPKTISGAMIAMLAVLALLVAGAVAMVVSRKGDDAAVAGGADTEEEAGGTSEGRARSAQQSPAASTTVATVGREATKTGPLASLIVRVFPGTFRDLSELRAADQAGKASAESQVPDGLLSLDHGVGHDAFGLVWEGDLVVPETGNYVFTLDVGDAATLRLLGGTILELDRSKDAGAAASEKVWLGKGPVAFRAEFFQSGSPGNLALRWSGQGLAGAQSLVRAPSGVLPPTIAVVSRRERSPAEPAPAAPEPERPRVMHEAAEKLAQDLVAYWSFDNRERGASRFVQRPDGSVLENLVTEDGQRIQYLVPTADLGTRWTEANFDATEWTVGLNGIGYEGKPGPYQPFLHTVIESAPRQYPFSVYLRIPFRVEDPDAYQDRGLVLFMKADDGFVAYLNGRQLATRNLLDPPVRWNSAAAEPVDDKLVLEPEPISVGRGIRYLEKGWNLLAIQGLNAGKSASGKLATGNAGATSSDMLIQARLVALRKGTELPPEAKAMAPSRHDRVVEEKMLKGSVKPAEGRFGDAYDFDDGGSVEVGARDDFAIGDDSFTVSAWFSRRPDSADNNARRLLSAGGGSDDKAGWALWISRKADALTFVVGNGEGRDTFTAKDASLANGEWRHVAVTVDRDNGMVFLFLDGRLVEERQLSFPKDEKLAANSGLALGRNSDGKDHHLGKLDDIAIWRRVLVPEEIERIHESETGLGAVFNREEQ